MHNILPPTLRKVKYAKGGEAMNKDKLPLEYPIKDALKIYALRWAVWLAIVFVALVPLIIYLARY